MHEEGVSIATIEEAAKESFGIGMGPFELMNVTGVPITLHATASLGRSLGAFYDSAVTLVPQVESKENWVLEGNVEADRLEKVANRLWGVVFHVATKLVDEGVSSPEDTDIGAKVGLRWPLGPFEKLNAVSAAKGAFLAGEVEKRYSLKPVPLLVNHSQSEMPFELKRVVLSVADGIGHITINRPDQLNAIDPETVAQLEACFTAAEENAEVRAIVIGGAGKAFVAGADVKFFVDKIRADSVADVVAFAAKGQDVYRQIELSKKPVICKLDGLSLGGGAELALACHVIVATEKASMGFPETGIGIYPGLGGTQRLTRRLGKGLARYFLYSGAVMSCADLEAWKIAWKVVPADELESAIVDAIENAPRQEAVLPASLADDWSEIAEFLGSATLDDLQKEGACLPEPLGQRKFLKKVGFKAPKAIQAIENLTVISANGDHEAGLAAETAGLQGIFSSKDALEGLSALLEHRRPTFIGE
jgi:enoyl-CoA hydratase/3-hydroxyacyl-CoA dehydrogenase